MFDKLRKRWIAADVWLIILCQLRAHNVGVMWKGNDVRGSNCHQVPDRMILVQFVDCNVVKLLYQ